MIRVAAFEYFLNGRDDTVAFCDTVTDTFIGIDGEFFWHSKNEMLETNRLASNPLDDVLIARLLGLAPMWFLFNHEEQISHLKERESEPR
jgi:hypothetical protein